MEKHPVVSPRHSDACRATAGQDELCPACRDERDWPHTIARLTRERDEARAELRELAAAVDNAMGMTGAVPPLTRGERIAWVREWPATLGRVVRDRSEAWDEVKRLRAWLRGLEQKLIAAGESYTGHNRECAEYGRSNQAGLVLVDMYNSKVLSPPRTGGDGPWCATCGGDWPDDEPCCTFCGQARNAG